MCRFLCNNIFPHHEGIVERRRGDFACVGELKWKCRDWQERRGDKDSCRNTRSDKHQKGCKNSRCKWLLGEQIGKIPAQLHALFQDTQTGRQKTVSNPSDSQRWDETHHGRSSRGKKSASKPSTLSLTWEKPKKCADSYCPLCLEQRKAAGLWKCPWLKMWHSVRSQEGAVAGISLVHSSFCIQWKAVLGCKIGCEIAFASESFLKSLPLLFVRYNQTANSKQRQKQQLRPREYTADFRKVVSVMCPTDAELIRFEKRARSLHPGGLQLKIPACADLPVVLLDVTSKRSKWVYLPHCSQTFHMEIVGLGRLRFSFDLGKEQQRRKINTWNGSQSLDLKSSLRILPLVRAFLLCSLLSHLIP